MKSAILLSLLLSFGGGIVQAGPATSEEVQFVSVEGGVKAPAKFPFMPGLTVSQAITAAGGFAADGDHVKVRVYRGGKITLLNVDMIVVDLSKDVLLKPGDRIVVP